MFDISPDDILRLDDEQLRELVARLVEADAQAHGYSSLHVTWGGNQTAADGGLDVRASLPNDAPNCGPGLPKPHTGYQVKKPDMGPALIIDEMRPKGKLRPVIQDLAKNGGAYIIISSTGTTTELRLAERRQAMRDALADCLDAVKLHTDFFDRTRIATWVRNHPGLILWVRSTSGREIHGWHSFGRWSHPQWSDKGPYLLDNRLIISVGNRRAAQYTAAEAISHLRELLNRPGQAVRLVGLSGVGKTRFVEALFETEIGQDALPKSAAVYTDLNFNPSPQPITLASTLIAQRQPAILIVDNCGGELHADLARTCAKPDSRLSLITIEYDVREDLPEETAVVTITAASIKLIEELVRRRFPSLAEEDARIIADAADGNARIALAIASTVRASESLTSLSSAELFNRLFWQRHEKDRSLLQAAQVLSLMYSFEIHDSASDSETSELGQLASLVKQDLDDLLQHIAELKRRELIQERDRWAAMLPHALANHLARRALQEINVRRVYRKVTEHTNSRLVCSLARRLAYLNDNPAARQICALLVEPSGYFADIRKLTIDEIKAIQDVALVVPDETLLAIERAFIKGEVNGVRIIALLPTIQLLALDEGLFDRCILLLETALLRNNDELSNQAHKILLSFFQAIEPQSHASIEARLAHIIRWRRSDDFTFRNLAETSLQQALSTELLASKSSTRSMHPLIRRARQFNESEYIKWYRSSLEATKYFRSEDGLPAEFVCMQLAKSFAALWTLPELRDDLVVHMVECGLGKMWQEGWTACYRALHRFEANETAEKQLRSLIGKFGPTGLGNEVLEVLLSTTLQWQDDLHPETYTAQMDRIDKVSESLGRKVGMQPDVIKPLAISLSKFGTYAFAFGRGLGSSVADPEKIWTHLSAIWSAAPSTEMNPTLLQGFIIAVRDRDRLLTDRWLDDLTSNNTLISILPALTSAVGWTELGIARLIDLSDRKAIPYEQYRHLYTAPKAGLATLADATQIMTRIAVDSRGFAVAVDVLLTWIAMASAEKSVPDGFFRDLCRTVLGHLDFQELTDPLDIGVADIATYALESSYPEARPLIEIFIKKIRESKDLDATYLGSREEFFLVISRLQPCLLLSVLYDGYHDCGPDTVRVMNNVEHESDHPGKVLTPTDLIAWCEVDPVARYDFALLVVPVVEPATEPGRMQLTAQARVILKHSPSPKNAFAGIINRLEPYSWTGSRAAVIEVNATALDEALSLFDDDFQTFAKSAKDELLQRNREQQRRDTAYQRQKNERFE